MIKLITLSCPHCPAPLHPQENQTLVACLYCNSTIRISYTEQTRPAAALSDLDDKAVLHAAAQGKRILV